MKKVKSNIKMLALTGAISTAVAGFGTTYMANAGQFVTTSENDIVLNVEKLDRDTIKIYLSNFNDLARSVQLSVKIDDGNVSFDDSQIKWLVNNDSNSIQTNYKIDSSKQEIQFFIVSDEVINSEDGIVEICEIDVSKNESLLSRLFKSSNGSYRVVPDTDNGEAYSYVTYSTNKSVSGNNIVNANNNKLTINTDPVIRFKEVSSVIGNKIVISKGTIFNINNYVEAFDADNNPINEDNIKYTGKIDNKKAGSYNIECIATDSYGDSSKLKATVVVEEETGQKVSDPVISGADDPIEVILGETFDLEKGVTAKDYMGRALTVKITGDFKTDEAGTYTVIYSATDRFDNTTTKERKLIIKEKASDPVPDPLPDDNTDSKEDDVKIPDNIKDIITENITPVSGDGTSKSPLLIETKETMKSEEFTQFLNSLNKFEVEEKSIENHDDYKILKLKLSGKASGFNILSLLRVASNSDEIYVNIKVYNNQTDLINIMNNYISQSEEKPGEDNSGSDTNNPSDTNKPSDADKPSDGGNSSGGNNSSGGSSSSSKNKWVQNFDGTWSFINSDGSTAKGWMRNNNEWYYLNDRGIMQTGWLKIDGIWYYLNSVSNGQMGAMQTGWLKSNGSWYYLNPISNGYKGAMKTGWHKDTDGKWYFLNANGAMHTGWYKDTNGKWYFLNANGSMKTGWHKDTNGKWYFLNKSGDMAVNTVIDGYKVDASGAWIK